MNKSTITALVLALLVLALLGSGAAGYLSLSNQIDIANTQTKSAEIRVHDLEKEVADLSETAQLAEERGRELSTLRNQTAELQKQVADLKNQSTNNRLTERPVIMGNWVTREQPVQPGQVFRGGFIPAPQNEQVQTAIQHININDNIVLDLNALVLTNPPAAPEIDFKKLEPIKQQDPAQVVPHMEVQVQRSANKERGGLVRRLRLNAETPPAAEPAPQKDKPTEEQF